MKHLPHISYFFLGITLLLLWIAPASAQMSAAKDIDPQVIEAWRKAGAQVGWHEFNKFGGWQFSTTKTKKQGVLPAFHWKTLQRGVLVNLPTPATPFAMYLRGRTVTDASLKELAKHQSLQGLDIRLTQVTDAGLKELTGFLNLQALSLWDAKVTDAGLKELAGFKNLQTLNLGWTKITDAGLRELSSLKNLQNLYITWTGVTDAGGKELAGFPSLQILDVHGTKVTEAGVNQLRKLRPNLMIFTR